MKPLRIVRIAADRLLPQWIVRFLWVVYGFLKPTARSFSQNGEDLIVRAYFDRIGLRIGTYLDIGCFHPVWISNTHSLHRRGWSGVAIDIDRFKLAAMKFARRGRVECILGAVCGSSEEGATAPVYKFDRGLSEIDTLELASAEIHRAEGRGEFRREEVALVDINRLMARLPHVDFINIDIEGLDKEVIIALDFERFRPTVVLFEENKAWGASPEVRRKLESAGYERLFVSGGSICYAIPPTVAG